MSLALITSIYGDYDQLVDPPTQEGVRDYIAVVDRHHDGVHLWHQVIEPRPHLHPRMAAKVAKCRPDIYTTARKTVWVDGGARLHHSGVAQWAAQHGPFAQFVHPQRDDVTAEAEVSAGMTKYANQPCLEQTGHYKTVGFPDHFGLWATGMIVRDHTWGGYVFARFGDAWLSEQLRWSYQDQLSEPYLLWKFDMAPKPLDGALWGNPHIGFTGHVSEL